MAARNNEVLETDRSFFRALLASDADALDDVLHPQFAIVDVGTGGVTERQQFIDVVARGEVQFRQIDTFYDEALVRDAGECSVIVGRTAMRFSMPGQGEVTAPSRYTHVYAPDPVDHRLRLFSAQGTTIAG